MVAYTLILRVLAVFAVRSLAQYGASFSMEGMSQPGSPYASSVPPLLPSGCAAFEQAYVQRLSDHTQHKIAINYPGHCSKLDSSEWHDGNTTGYYTVVSEPCSWAAGQSQLSYGTLTNMCKGLGRTWHWHEDADEWGWVERGQFQTWISSPSGLPWEAAANEVGPEGVWYFPRGWAHAFLCLTPEEEGGCAVHLVFSGPLAAVTGAHNLDKTLAQAPLSAVAVSLQVNEEEFGLARRQFEGAAGDPESGKFISPMVGMVPFGTCEPKCPKIRETKVLPAAVPGDVASKVALPGGLVVKQIRTSQFPFSTTMSQEQVDLPPGASRALYWTTNANSLLVVTQGKIRLTLQGGLGGAAVPPASVSKKMMEYELKRGDIVYVPVGKALTYSESTKRSFAQVIAVFDVGSWHSAELRDQLRHIPSYVMNMSLTHTALNSGNAFKPAGLKPAASKPAVRSSEPCTCGNGKVKLWGPGGPHTALVPAAALFNKKQAADAQIEICFGPEAKWRPAASSCAAGLYTAAEQQMAGFLRTYGHIINGSTVFPVTMHAAGLVVPASNPKNIRSLLDVVNRDDIRVVVNDGNYVGSLTSGTAVWEDVVGRFDSLQAISSVRSKIVYYAGGSGKARDQLVNGAADVWFSWYDWYVANKDKFTFVALENENAIVRPLSVAYTSNDGGDVVQKFIELLLHDGEADAAMQAWGWFKNGAQAKARDAGAMPAAADRPSAQTLADLIKDGVKCNKEASMPSKRARSVIDGMVES
eukprot:TRINITY_DN3710_c0_g1_i1.p1 TRINITY_DN3710_c0_g1~~TRINITY_DN3710_c0_g1_i1.p1  ORF type:complete len:755 (-),score=135.50 TRINITY_DN3710_c0_g1_i1:129-2393(-)